VLRAELGENLAGRKEGERNALISKTHAGTDKRSAAV